VFTGIVQDIGRIKSIEKKRESAKISIETNINLEDMRAGDSIAVEGACLTVTNIKRNVFTADLSQETLALTTIGDFKAADHVNLEKALIVSDSLGGHFVTGHVDAVGILDKKNNLDKGYLELIFTIPGKLMSQIAKKGSIAVDGISLTVAEVSNRGFRSVIVPHTMDKTTLPSKRPGEKVNIETDIIAKYVQSSLNTTATGGVTEDLLNRYGYK